MQFSKSTAILPTAILLAALTLSGCKTDTEFDERGGFKIARSPCPATAIATYTGDITLFNPPADRSVDAIDVTANITNLQGSCYEGAADGRIQVQANFAVQARRAKAGPARTVSLPWFATVLRGGTQLESKQIGTVTLNFADGELRASQNTSATGFVSRAAATLPPEIVNRINRKRKAGDADAALDPM
ncbi:MAG: hypothetical protein EOP61_41540, partial [Sphingomonadales bacterium]